MDSNDLYKAGFATLSHTGLSSVARRIFGGRGGIFMLHHVRPEPAVKPDFAPNRGLTVTPEFLEMTLAWLQKHSYEFVSLEDAVTLLLMARQERRFAVFTLDDGYLDNLEYALPIFRKYQCPFTVFVAPAITDGKSALWWNDLEAIIATGQPLRSPLPGEELLKTTTTAEKNAAWNTLYWPLRDWPEKDMRDWIADTAAGLGINTADKRRDELMSWKDLRLMVRDPLCSIGAHTINHVSLAKLSPELALEEINGSRLRIAAELGVTTKTFSYPYGGSSAAGPRDFELVAEAGFLAGVTTRKGLLMNRHGNRLTGLPRVPLNGDFQTEASLDAFMSGLPFSVWKRLPLQAHS